MIVYNEILCNPSENNVEEVINESEWTIFSCLDLLHNSCFTDAERGGLMTKEDIQIYLQYISSENKLLFKYAADYARYVSRCLYRIKEIKKLEKSLLSADEFLERIGGQCSDIEENLDFLSDVQEKQGDVEEYKQTKKSTKKVILLREQVLLSIKGVLDGCQTQEIYQRRQLEEITHSQEEVNIFKNEIEKAIEMSKSNFEDEKATLTKLKNNLLDNYSSVLSAYRTQHRLISEHSKV